MNNKVIYTLMLFAIITTGCLNFAGDCETQIKGRYFNPSGNIQAVIDVTDCGATTTPSYGVRIIESRDTTDNGSPDNTVLGSRRGVKVWWNANDTLMIQGADTTTGYTKKNVYPLGKHKGEVIIVYKD